MTTSETARTFMGMNIVGDYSQGAGHQVPQRPASELAPFFSAVFAGGVIDGVRWTQYTPYFNDGNACVFSANEYSVMVRLVGRQPSEEELVEMEANAETGDAGDFSEGWVETESYSDDDVFSQLIGHKVYQTDASGRRDYKVAPSFAGPHPELVEAVDALRDAIAGGAFDNALRSLFGDHARVMVPAQGDIEVETYDHD